MSAPTHPEQAPHSEPVSSPPGKRLLYASSDLVVRFVDAPGSPRDLCVATFDSFTNLETLDRNGFGEAFFESRAVPALHVISRRNLWYQEPDLPDALAAAALLTSDFARVLAYGSSMGGYGAIRFGAALGADIAVAISPQYSIDPRAMPSDNRWVQHGRMIRFVNEERSFPPIARAIVFFDPHDADRLHVEKLAGACDVVPVRLPFAGHPAGAYLAETGLLQAALFEIAEGRFEPAGFEKRARAARSSSGQYLYTLARLQPLHRIRLKLALARRAVAASPGDPEYRGYLGIALACLGRTVEAEAAFRDALRHGGDQPLSLERYGRFLLAMGRLSEAAPVLDRAMALGGELVRVRRSCGLLRLAERDWTGARQLLGRVLREHARSRRAVLAEVATVLRWLLAGARRGSPDEAGSDRPPRIRIGLLRDLTVTPIPPRVRRLFPAVR